MGVAWPGIRGCSPEYFFFISILILHFEHFVTKEKGSVVILNLDNFTANLYVCSARIHHHSLPPHTRYTLPYSLKEQQGGPMVSAD